MLKYYLTSLLHQEWQVTAYATADEYDLNKLLDGLTHQGLYVSAGINPGNTNNDKMSTSPGMHSDSHAHLSSKSGSHASSHSVPGKIYSFMDGKKRQSLCENVGHIQ